MATRTPAQPPKKPRPLTLKQQRFVQELPLARSQTEAAIKAGYSASSRHVAESAASETLRIPGVKAAVAAIHDASKFAAILSIGERKQRLSRLAEPDPEHPDPIRAIDTLNRMESVYVDRSMSLNANVDLTELEGFSLEELRELLRKTKG